MYCCPNQSLVARFIVIRPSEVLAWVKVERAAPGAALFLHCQSAHRSSGNGVETRTDEQHKSKENAERVVNRRMSCVKLNETRWGIHLRIGSPPVRRSV